MTGVEVAIVPVGDTDTKRTGLLGGGTGTGRRGGGGTGRPGAGPCPPLIVTVLVESAN